MFNPPRMVTPHSQTPPDGGGNINNTNSSPLTFLTPAQLLQTLIPFRNHIMFIRKLTLFSCLVAVKAQPAPPAPPAQLMRTERLVIEDFISLYPLILLNDNGDLGTCGNACCSLDYKITGLTPDEIVAMIEASVDADGGPDGRYSLAPLAEGGEGFFDPVPSILIGQLKHKTASEVFTDTVNFVMRPWEQASSNSKSKGSSEDYVLLRVFSISEIGGSLFDFGQNFYNIVTLMESLGWEDYQHVDGSCPDRSANTGKGKGKGKGKPRAVVEPYN